MVRPGPSLRFTNEGKRPATTRTVAPAARRLPLASPSRPLLPPPLPQLIHPLCHRHVSCPTCMMLHLRQSLPLRRLFRLPQDSESELLVIAPFSHHYPTSAPSTASFEAFDVSAERGEAPMPSVTPTNPFLTVRASDYSVLRCLLQSLPLAMEIEEAPPPRGTSERTHPLTCTWLEWCL